jgi:hypothetical protein
MKKIIFIVAFLFGSWMAPTAADAQIDIRVNIGMRPHVRQNIRLQPIWGPVGFDYVEYYYIPELDIYYHVPSANYVYRVRGRWVARKILPREFRNFDFFRTWIIVVNESSPYYMHDRIVRNYVKNRNRKPYLTIRDSRNPRYYANRNHPYHKEYYKYYDRYEDRNDRYRDNYYEERRSDRRIDDRREDKRGDDNRRYNEKRVNAKQSERRVVKTRETSERRVSSASNQKSKTTSYRR